MKLILTIDKQLQITSTFRNNARDVELADLTNGETFHIGPDEEVPSKTISGFNLSAQNGDIVLQDPRRTLIVQTNGQCRTPLVDRNFKSIDAKITGEEGDTGDLIGINIERLVVH